MSGTSMDGIDAALIESDGESLVRPIAFLTIAYDEAMRAKLRRAMEVALSLDTPRPEPQIDAIATEQTLAHAAAVKALLDRAGLTGADIDVIGFHGQTIAHRPDRGWTWQMGDGALLARTCGAVVVNDFRSADVAAGGQGAPLAPVYHRALVEPLREVRGLGCRQGVAVLNLGGVGNITWFGAMDEDWGSFDTGPANALIDDWMRAKGGLSHDEGGATAAAGRVHEDVLEALLDRPWFDQPPPKSLDRSDFSLDAVRGLSLEDGAATLTAFTAETVRLAFRHLPDLPARLLVTGGGRHNATMMRMMRERLAIPVDPVEAVGWNGDALEAEAFAYMALRVLAGLPTSYPQMTGVPRPLGGGQVHRP